MEKDPKVIDPFHPKLASIPKILIGQTVFIPTYFDWRGNPEPLLVETCVPAYAHAVFILNGQYLIKDSDAISEARRIQWAQKSSSSI